MPSYLHECRNQECLHEFEDFYSITKDPPTTCPKCQQETVVRVISGGSGRGIMQLSDDEFKASLPEQVAKLKKEAHSSERTYSNLLGEDRYQQKQSEIDYFKRNKY